MKTASAFISYSRQDKDLVRRLHQALSALNREVWVDWQDIPPTAQWLNEVYSAIEAAENFVFILSPDSVTSEICAMEVSHAVKCNKRLVPIVSRQVDAKTVPAALANINWLFCLESDDFSRAVDQLVKAIDTDLDWVRAHTRLLIRAKEWESRRRDTSLGLRGRDLEQAEQWLSKSGNKEPRPTPLHTEYILASRKTETRRQKLLFTAVTVGLIIAVGLAIVAWYQRTQKETQRQIAFARQLATQAQLTRTEADHLLTRSVLLSVESVKLKPSFEGDSLLRSGMSLLPRAVVQIKHRKRVTAVAFSPDGRYLATASDDRTIQVSDRTSGTKVFHIDTPDHIYDVFFSPNGKYLAAGWYDKVILLWDVATGREIVRLIHENKARAVSFSPDGKYLATVSWDNAARVWEVPKGQEVARMVHKDVVLDVAFSWDSQFVITGSGDKTARVWKTDSGVELMRLRHPSRVFATAVSQNAKFLITGSEDGAVWVWDRSTGREITRLKHDKVWDLAISPDSEYIAYGSGDKTLHLWQTTTGKEVTRMMHQAIIRRVTFSPDSKLVATISDDMTGRVWDVPSGREIMRLPHDGKVHAIAFSTDGKYVATASSDNTAQVWEVTMAPEVSVLFHEDAVNKVKFSRDGRYLATTTQKIARVWEINTGRESMRVISPGLESVAFSPDTKYLATAGRDGTARLWDITSGTEVMRLTHKGTVYAVDFSDDGNYVVTGSQAASGKNAIIWKMADGRAVWGIGYNRDIVAVGFSEKSQSVVTASGGLFRDDRVARVWSLDKGEEIMRMAHEGGVTDVTFSPDGRHVGTGSLDTTARVWETSTGHEVTRFKHEYWVVKISFSSDGKYLATAGLDGAYVWDVLSGNKIVRIPAISGAIYDVSLSSDGRYVATASEDKTARVWYLRPQDLIQKACERLTRNLRPSEWREYMGEETYRATCENIGLPTGDADPLWKEF